MIEPLFTFQLGNDRREALYALRAPCLVLRSLCKWYRRLLDHFDGSADGGDRWELILLRDQLLRTIPTFNETFSKALALPVISEDIHPSFWDLPADRALAFLEEDKLTLPLPEDR